MKVTAHDDFDGRMIAVEMRLRMVQESLAAIASAWGNLGAPSEKAITAFAEVIEEIADEVAAIHNLEVKKSHAEYEARLAASTDPEDARLLSMIRKVGAR